MEMALMVPPETWVSASGEQLDHQRIADVMLLVRACDNALGRAERPHNANGFTQTPAQNANAVLEKYMPEQIDAVLRRVMECRSHPAVPPTTEALLPRFAELVEKLWRG